MPRSNNNKGVHTWTHHYSGHHRVTTACGNSNGWEGLLTMFAMLFVPGSGELQWRENTKAETPPVKAPGVVMFVIIGRIKPTALHSTGKFHITLGHQYQHVNTNKVD